MAPWSPQKGQINSDGFPIPQSFWTPMLHQKILNIFGTGCHNVCTSPLNGAHYMFILIFWSKHPCQSRNYTIFNSSDDLDYWTPKICIISLRHNLREYRYRMEASLQSDLLDTAIYQSNYRSWWLAISDQNTHHSHCLWTFSKSDTSQLYCLGYYI